MIRLANMEQIVIVHGKVYTRRVGGFRLSAAVFEAECQHWLESVCIHERVQANETVITKLKTI